MRTAPVTVVVNTISCCSPQQSIVVGLFLVYKNNNITWKLWKENKQLDLGCILFFFFFCWRGCADSKLADLVSPDEERGGKEQEKKGLPSFYGFYLLLYTASRMTPINLSRRTGTGFWQMTLYTERCVYTAGRTEIERERKKQTSTLLALFYTYHLRPASLVLFFGWNGKICCWAYTAKNRGIRRRWNREPQRGNRCHFSGWQIKICVRYPGRLMTWLTIKKSASAATVRVWRGKWRARQLSQAFDKY